MLALRPGAHSLVPYLSVLEADRLLPFLQQVFGATVIQRLTGAGGRVGHAEVRIGESTVMVGEAGEDGPDPAELAVRVPDLEETARRAALRGCRVVERSAREVVLVDPWGNRWRVTRRKRSLLSVWRGLR